MRPSSRRQCSCTPYRIRMTAGLKSTILETTDKIIATISVLVVFAKAKTNICGSQTSTEKFNVWTMNICIFGCWKLKTIFLYRRRTRTLSYWIWMNEMNVEIVMLVGVFFFAQTLNKTSVASWKKILTLETCQVCQKNIPSMLLSVSILISSSYFLLFFFLSIIIKHNNVRERTKKY